MIDCETCREQLAELALDPPWLTSRADVAEHLGRCPACQRELAEIQAAWALLPLALPAAAPSPQLFQRIASQLPADELPAVVPFQPTRRERVLSYLLAASVLVGLTIGATAYVRVVRDDPTPDEIAQERSAQDLARRLANLQQMERLLEAKNVRLVSLAKPQAPNEVAAYVVWDLAARQGHLYAFDLPAAAEGFRYQLWTTGAEGALTAGPEIAVSADGLGSAVVDVPPQGGPGAGKAIVTLEPAGAAERPSGKVVLESAL